jgi:methylated-DNA-[protein]-cysteine S-methyltransferase
MNLEQELHELPIDGEHGLEQLLHEGRRRVEHALRKHRRPLAKLGIIGTQIGDLLIAEGPRGIVAIHFIDTKGAGNPIPALREKFDLVQDQRAAERIGDEIRRYIAGDRAALRHPIELSLVDSEFQRRAYLKLRQVPAGSVVTYQGLAAAVGAPDGQRAIGNTMATNPVPIYVPCHRVIRSDGSIGNYGGGVARKIKLLRAEGFEVGADLRVPARAVFGHSRTHIYCRPQCSAAMRADRGRMFIFGDPERARRAGLRACKLCRPA